MTTLSLEASKKIFELVGEYETEEYHEGNDGWTNEITGEHDYIPRPNFAELLRLLPAIAEKANWPKPTPFREMGRLQNKVMILASKYTFALTEEEGMRMVEEYLMKLL